MPIATNDDSLDSIKRLIVFGQVYSTHERRVKREFAQVTHLRMAMMYSLTRDDWNKKGFDGTCPAGDANMAKIMLLRRQCQKVYCLYSGYKDLSY